MLHVTEYFAKSLKITGDMDGTIRQIALGFHSNYGPILYHHRKRISAALL